MSIFTNLDDDRRRGDSTNDNSTGSGSGDRRRGDSATEGGEQQTRNFGTTVRPANGVNRDATNAAYAQRTGDAQKDFERQMAYYNQLLAMVPGLKRDFSTSKMNTMASGFRGIADARKNVARYGGMEGAGRRNALYSAMANPIAKTDESMQGISNDEYNDQLNQMLSQISGLGDMNNAGYGWEQLLSQAGTQKRRLEQGLTIDKMIGDANVQNALYGNTGAMAEMLFKLGKNKEWW